MDSAAIPSMLSPAQMLVMLLSVVAGLLMMIGFVFWGARHAYEERQRLRCPIRPTMATVLFSLTPDGAHADVLRCSRFPGGPPLGCGKACLYATAT